MSAFCDTLLGGDGADLLIGDFSTTDQNAPGIVIQGDGGNAISAFRDRLDGGDGNDTLLGEGSADNVSIDESIRGTFGGRAVLFSDTLIGGAGDDLIAGGLGSDSMAGGTGSDRFFWSFDDLTLGIFGTGEVRFSAVDDIADFTLNDTLDLRAFGSEFNSLTADDIRVRVEDGDTTVSIQIRPQTNSRSWRC